MVNKGWVLAVVAFAATSVVEAERPRIYFPVKRSEASNAIWERQAAIEKQESEARRGLLDGVVGDVGNLLGGDPTQTGSNGGGLLDPIIGDGSSTSSSSSNDSKTKSNNDDGTKTKSDGGDGTKTTAPDAQSTSDGNLVGSLVSGLLGGGPTSTQASDAQTTDSSSSDGSSSAGGGDAKTTSDGNLVGSLVSGLLGGPTSTQASDPKTTDDPTSTKAADPTTTSGGLLGSIISGLLPTSTTKAQGAETTSDGGNILSSILGLGTTTTTKASQPTDTSKVPPQATTSGNIISSILGLGTTTTTKAPSQPTTTSKPGTETGTTVDPDPPTTSHTAGQGTHTTGLPTTTNVPVANQTRSETDLPTTTHTQPTQLTTTDLPAHNATTTEPSSQPTTTTKKSDADTTKSTEAPSHPVVTTPAETSSHESEQVPLTTTQKSELVTSIKATATVSNSENWMPTTIVAEASSISFKPPTSQASATTTGLPTNVPHVILPDDPNKPPPEGTIPIQIGFLYPLNYLFVAKNTVAAAQIFRYLPEALAAAAKLDTDKLRVSMLVPDDTRDIWGYVTTIAKVDYPKNLVQQLQMDLWAPNSLIYTNPDGIVRNLTAVINPKIDIYGTINGDGGTDGSNGGSGSGGGGSNGNNDAFGGSGGGDTSAKTKGTVVGITMGALGLAGLYGGAMFIIARRYKRKRQGHQRSSSITSSSQASSEMQYTGAGSPALMGGALLSHDFSSYGGVQQHSHGRESQGSGGTGGTNRTANISAPVAAENSLGWN